MTKVLIVEDDPITRALFEMYVKNSEEFELLASMDNASIAEVYCTRNPVDLILMDVITANGNSGLIAAEKIKKNYPNIKIIIMTSQPECDFLDRAKNAGLDSFWYKEPSEESILTVMKRTMQGERIYPEETPVLQIGEIKSTEFTSTELEILRELTSGETDEVIAYQLNMSPWTVRKYIQRMLEKTGFKSRTQLAIAAREQGLVIRGY